MCQCIKTPECQSGMRPKKMGRVEGWRLGVFWFGGGFCRHLSKKGVHIWKWR